MRLDDWPQVREIYRKGIETGNATFETEVPDWEEWDRSQPSARGARRRTQRTRRIVGFLYSHVGKNP